MAIKDLPIFCSYDVQRFTQFGSMDCANWYGVQVKTSKRGQAMYPAMGRKHVNALNENRLIFNAEPRQIFRTIDYVYVIDGGQVFQIDSFFNQRLIGNVALDGFLSFDYLTVGTEIRALLSDSDNLYLITETNTSVSMVQVTDSLAPARPLHVASFGNRFVVSEEKSPYMYLTNINFNGGAAGGFTVNGASLFAQASGNIGQLGVLHAQLYVFTNFTTDIWANIPSNVTAGSASVAFPWKRNTSYNFDYGIADPNSLSIDFGRMCWLAQNKNGLVSFMMSTGGQPQDISNQAVNVLLERATDIDELSAFLRTTSNGFLYQYENSIFYRVSAGSYENTPLIDERNTANALEYNFQTGVWARVIELNGERNRIKRHVYFNNRHLVTLEGDKAIYEMAGNIYFNEYLDDAQTFIKEPMRYELVTPHIFEPDYSEFAEDYVQIDFVFGNKTFYRSQSAFDNTTFIVGEESTADAPVYVITEDEKYIIAERGNTPDFDDNHYDKLFKPFVGLYYSDDGGISFHYADAREFSPLGAYQWRMRWYELGSSRNRVYKLICVSSAPIVILGAVRNTRRVSGGQN